MTWKCNNCGIKINKDLAYPVRCSCGHVDYGNGRYVMAGVSRQHTHVVDSALLDKRLATCRSCSHFIPPGRCKWIDAGCSRTFRETLANPHEACPKELWGSVIVIDCDTHGFGDCMTAAWLAEGAKEAGIPLALAATGEKARLLRVFGIDPIGPTTGMLRLFDARCREHEALAGSETTRPQLWIRELQLPEFEPIRPQFRVSETAKKAAAPYQSVPYIVMCPQSQHQIREWPITLWRELARRVELTGHTVYFLGEARRDCLDLPNWISSDDWEFSVALLAGAELVVGVDSAPVNVAGTCGTRCVVLLGPTTIDAFRHLNPIHWVTLPESVMPCVGCWFNGPCYSAAKCRSGCEAMARISVMQVFDVIESTNVQWRRRVDLSPPPRGTSILDCSIHGLGDCVVAAWLAYGTRYYDRRIGLHAANRYAEVIELFGLPVYAMRPPGGQDRIERQFRAGMAHIDQQTQCYPPRLWLWARELGLQMDLARPQHTITQDEVRASVNYETARSVLFFPESTHGARFWVDAYWDELRDMLAAEGCDVLSCGSSVGRHQFRSYREMAAAMLNAALVVGVDSGPAHLAGTLDIPTVTLHGVTRPTVFAHLPSVRGVVIEPQELPCVTCTFNPWQYTDSCEYHCAAMSLLTPDRVLPACLEALRCS